MRIPRHDAKKAPADSIRCSLGNERGQVAILVAMLLPAFLIMCGLALDVGWVFYNKQKIQHAADLAALAAAQYLPTDTSMARSKAVDYFVLNYGTQAPLANVNLYQANMGIKVHCEQRVPLHFGPIVGVQDVLIAVQAEAQVEAAHQPHYLVPLGISNKVNFAFGNKITLYGNTADPVSGNFGIVDPTPGGRLNPGDIERLLYDDYQGEQGMPAVGDSIYTKTGKMSTSIANGINTRLAMGKTTFVAVVVDWSKASGGKPVPVLGYALFDCLSVSAKDAGQVSITGTFREFIDPTLITNPKDAYYGLKAVRLVK